MKKALSIIIIILVAVIAVQDYRLGRIIPEREKITVIHDTITVVTPAPVSIAETGQIRTKLPVARPITVGTDKMTEIDEKETVTVIDNLPMAKDSTEVVIPIFTKVYQDSTYRAVISGYNASLDSIQIYRNTVYVDHFREGTKMVRPGRWAISLQVGYGTDFRGMRPYLGIGVSYNLFEF
jgi:hypothetical protein